MSEFLVVAKFPIGVVALAFLFRHHIKMLPQREQMRESLEATFISMACVPFASEIGFYL